VASGGETARLMLALKSTLAHADATPTLIFDEIDQGIGGRVGAIVGQKLWLLTGEHTRPAQNGDGAAAHQVLCITHSAAAWLPLATITTPSASRFWRSATAKRTRTVVETLDGGGAHRRTGADARRAQAKPGGKLGGGDARRSGASQSRRAGA
jgi:DNA repair ATPase RecN